MCLLIWFLFFLVPGEPTNLEAKVLNSSTVGVTWDPPIDKDQNGIIRGYQIHVQPKNVVSWPNLPIKYQVLSFRFQIYLL